MTHLEQHGEVGREVPTSLSYPISEARVGDVGVDRFRVEMVRQVETADGEPDRVLRTYLDVFEEP